MSPELSVVLVAASGSASIGRVLRCLCAQTRAGDIELIIVAPRDAPLDVSGLDRRLHAVEVVRVAEITRRGDAAAAGVRAARSPVVALVEDHAFPEPGWAEALLGAHADERWTGVGPVVEDANPTTSTGRVSFLLTYGSLSGRQSPGKRTLLPWHNSSYKRERLAPYAGRLEAFLAWEGTLQSALVADGHALFLEPAARTRHVNVSRLRSAVGLHFQRGRITAAERATEADWRPARRALQLVLVPLFPAGQLRHLLPELRRLRTPLRRRVVDAPVLAAFLVVFAAGQAVGYLFGRGEAIDRIEGYELDRRAHLAPRDLAVLATDRL